MCCFSFLELAISYNSPLPIFFRALFTVSSDRDFGAVYGLSQDNPLSSCWTDYKGARLQNLALCRGAKSLLDQRRHGVRRSSKLMHCKIVHPTAPKTGCCSPDAAIDPGTISIRSQGNLSRSHKSDLPFHKIPRAVTAAYHLPRQRLFLSSNAILQRFGFFSHQIVQGHFRK